MGFLGKLFGRPTDCPACHTPWAKVTLGGVQCVRPGCEHYSHPYAVQQVRAGRLDWRQLPEFQKAVAIQYVNYRGERKTFYADPLSLQLRGQRLSACVAPNGVRLSLNLKGIGNLKDLHGALAPEGVAGPTPHEAYVMKFHRRRGTTSALYESLRAKYPTL